MAPSKDAGEDLPMRLRRVRYRAWHRGTREMDLMLGPFADAKTSTLAGAALLRLVVAGPRSGLPVFRIDFILGARFILDFHALGRRLVVSNLLQSK